MGGPNLWVSKLRGAGGRYVGGTPAEFRDPQSGPRQPATAVSAEKRSTSEEAKNAKIMISISWVPGSHFFTGVALARVPRESGSATEFTLSDERTTPAPATPAGNNSKPIIALRIVLALSMVLTCASHCHLGIAIDIHMVPRTDRRARGPSMRMHPARSRAE